MGMGKQFEIPPDNLNRYMVGIKKVPIYRPYNGTGNFVPFPFHSRLISVRLPFLSVFKPFPFLPRAARPFW